MSMTLEGRTVFVTGASGGIGLATAKALGACGANVIAHWRSDREGVGQAVAEIPKERHHLVQADFRNAASARQAWADALSWKGRIDVLVNNAGVLPRAGVSANDSTWDESWDLTFAVNVRAPAELLRSAVNHFLDESGGVLITISSWVAQRGSGNENLIAYAASKAAITAATKTIARSYAKDDIFAYCIAPGPVDTGMTSDSALDQGGQEAVLAALAMGELVPPQEIAELVVHLSTGRAKHLSGATLDVNGASYIR